MSYSNIDRIVKTDVLVIGGAGAAVSAAVSAYEKGAKVTMVSKGKVGRSGNTIMIGGGFGIDGESAKKICGEEAADLNYTKDDVFESVVKNSFYLSDQNIAEQFAEESPYAVKQCIDWARNAKQIFQFIPPATLWNTSGRSFGNALARGMKENPGVDVMEDVIVVDVLLDDGVAVGAIGVEVYSGEIILFEAKAVIIGTGGYQPYSLKNSISDMTGDGIAMGYRAGAKIADMEFLLFIPTAVEPYNLRGSIVPYLFTVPVFFPMIYKITDGDGNEIEIPEKCNKVPGASKMMKIILSYYWGKSIYESYDEHGNCMYYDFSHCTEEEIEEAFEGFANHFSTWHKKGTYNRIDLEELKATVLRDRKIKVGLGCEYSMGGIVIDENMSTGVPGLFAAGEVTSGLFGAFRGGDGLTEMLAHGFRAGKSAAEYAEDAAEGKIDSQQVDSIVETIMEPFKRDEGVSPYKVQEKIETAADRGFNFFRDEEGLANTVKTYEKIREDMIPNMALSSKSRKYNFQWITSILVRNLILCNEVGARAAQMRKESRGCHMRVDYPEVNNDEWLVKIEAQQEGDEIKISTRKPVVTRKPLPKGKFKSIPDYILDTLED
ncbi:MAG TPA: FAD-binding protein [Tepidimicrobium sp.]|nr:FAD-binding protein [Tepidimicrobium sp.]